MPSTQETSVKATSADAVNAGLTPMTFDYGDVLTGGSDVYGDVDGSDESDEITMFDDTDTSDQSDEVI